MRIKSLAVLLLALAMLLTGSACSGIDTDTDSVLHAPKLTGDMYNIQQALELGTNRKYDLKYPRTGDYLTAFVLRDVDRDGHDEVFAFYSFQDDTEGNINMSMIDSTEDGWRITDTVTVQASGVESISFADLDGNGSQEVLVGWSLFSTIQQQLSVYGCDGGSLVQRLSRPYTTFVTADLMEVGFSQLLVVTLDSTEKTAEARLYQVPEGGAEEEGNVSLDGNISGYLTPVVGKLASQRPAVYLDANKGTSSMITEIIYYMPLDTISTPVLSDENSDFSLMRTSPLVSPFHDNSTRENNITARQAPLPMRDMDGDGVMEMPTMLELPGNQQTKLYLSTWRNYNEEKFTEVCTAVMNDTYGYYLKYPAAWLGEDGIHVTVSVSKEDSLYTFSTWDNEARIRTVDLLKLQVFTTEEWENRNMSLYADYFSVAVSGDRVYAAWLTRQDTPYTIDETTLRECFVLE